MQLQLPLNFNQPKCIFNHFEIPDDNQWIFDLIDKYNLCDQHSTAQSKEEN